MRSIFQSLPHLRGGFWEEVMSKVRPEGIGTGAVLQTAGIPWTWIMSWRLERMLCVTSERLMEESLWTVWKFWLVLLGSEQKLETGLPRPFLLELSLLLACSFLALHLHIVFVFKSLSSLAVPCPPLTTVLLQPLLTRWLLQASSVFLILGTGSVYRFTLAEDCFASQNLTSKKQLDHSA